MNVKNPNCDEDGEGDEEHGEEEILAEEGDGQRAGRDDLGQQEEEHSEREEDGDAESDLDT